MITNPALEELWRAREDLAREAGHDLRRLGENARKWAEAHPHLGPVATGAEEVRTLAAREEAAGAMPVRRETPAACEPKPANTCPFTAP